MYKHEPAPDQSGQAILLDGDAIGIVCDQDSAETLIGYLNGGEGGFTIDTFVDDPREGETEGERTWVFVNREDTWVAYTHFESTAEALLTHLNRND